MSDLVARLRELHARRKGTWLLDGMSHGQTTWDDMCAHCRKPWPCATIRLLDETASTP